MVMLKIQWAQPARKCKYPHSEQQQMPREQKPAINWSFKKIIHNLCQQTRKGLKWFQSTVMDQKKSKKSVQRECSHQSLPEPGSFLPAREHKGARGQHSICAVKPFQQSCTLLKSHAGCALLAERLPWQESGGAGKEEQIRFLPDSCFLRVQLNSKRSPSQTHRRWIVQITYNLVLLIYNSTASDKEKNLKCSAPFKQEASPWWRARGFVTCFSSTPCCTHTMLRSGELQQKNCTQAPSCRLHHSEINVQLPLPELGVQITKGRATLKHLSCKLL